MHHSVNAKIRYGIIDVDGNWVINAKYNKIKESGIKNLWWFKESDKGLWGAIDSTGKRLLKPSLAKVSKYAGNFVWVTHPGKGWFKLDKKLKKASGYLLDNKYSTYVYSQHNLVEASYKNEDKITQSGLLDLNGNWLVEPEYHQIVLPDSKGEPIWLITKAHQGFAPPIEAMIVPIDRPTNKGITMKLGWSPSGFREGLASAMNRAGIFSKASWGFVDHNGQWAISPKFIKVSSFYGGKAVVQVKNKKAGYGVINKKGKWVIKPEYSALSHLDEDRFFALKLNGNRVMIDDKGVEISAEIYGGISTHEIGAAFKEGLVPVGYYNKDISGYMDRQGKIIFTAKYSAGNEFHGDYAIIYHKEDKPAAEGKYGLIKRDGKIQIAPRYDSLLHARYTPGLYIARVNAP